MKIKRERLSRMALFSLLAIFALLLIGSEHNTPGVPQKSVPARIAAEMRGEIPTAVRGSWDRAVEKRPLWLLEVSSRCE